MQLYHGFESQERHVISFSHAVALSGREFVEILATPSVGERRNYREVWEKPLFRLLFLTTSPHLILTSIGLEPRLLVQRPSAIWMTIF